MRILDVTMATLQGGMCQVMFTNPIEIVKIRLQVAGEMAGTSKLGAWQVMKELGFMGLYKVRLITFKCNCAPLKQENRKPLEKVHRIS